MPGETPVENSGGESCGTLLQYAPSLDADEFFCDVAKGAEPVCCPVDKVDGGEDATSPQPSPKVTPAPVDTGATGGCSVCPGGLTVDADTVIPFEEANGAKCGQMINFSQNPNLSEEDCAEMKAAEAICCPVDGADDTTSQPSSKVTPAPVVQTEDTPAPVVQTEVTPAPVIPAEDTPAPVVQTDITPAPVVQTEITPAPVVQTDITPAPVLQTETGCSFCTEGLTVEEDTVIPFEEANGANCGDALGYSQNPNLSEQACSEMILAEAICCPVATENPCTVCEGATIDDTQTAGESGRTCSALVAEAAVYDAESEQCADSKGLIEAGCCPASSDNPCTLCADTGVTGDDTETIGESGKTCSELVADALFSDADSEECSDTKDSIEAQCCPPATQNPCSVCAGGLTVDESTVIGNSDRFTCGTLMEDKLTVEEDSDTCTQMQRTEDLCCPPQAENPCSFCAGVVPADGSTPVGDEADGITCFSLSSDALTVEEESEMCTEMKEAELTCCPAEAAVSVVPTPVPMDGCQVCVDGLTVLENTVIGEGRTCGGMIADALDQDPDSGVCRAMQQLQDNCCPYADNPCVVCPDGITVADETEIETEEFTCGGLRSSALAIDATSETCAAIQLTETTCCPAVEGAVSVVPTPAPQIQSAIISISPTIDNTTSTENVTTVVPTSAKTSVSPVATPTPTATVTEATASTETDLPTPSPIKDEGIPSTPPNPSGPEFTPEIPSASTRLNVSAMLGLLVVTTSFSVTFIL